MLLAQLGIGTALTAGTSTTNFSSSGAISGEAANGVTLTPDAAGLSATTAAGAAYVVTPSLATGTGGFLESNYSVTYNPYNGIVSAKALTITAENKTKVYDGAVFPYANYPVSIPLASSQEKMKLILAELLLSQEQPFYLPLWVIMPSHPADLLHRTIRSLSKMDN